jgi:UDP-N-acetylmuramate dehydrogenase
MQCGHRDASEIRELLLPLTCGDISLNVPLSTITRWKVGGSAALIVTPLSGSEVPGLVRALVKHDIPYIVVGDASNLLFDSDGLNAVVLRVGRNMSRVEVSGLCIRAEAGAWVPCVARTAGGRGLAGLEHTVGIPGTIGGLVYMNGGSQRKGIGSNTSSVDVCTRHGDYLTLTHEELDFAYRTSSLQGAGLIVLTVELLLSRADPVELRREMIDIMRDRRKKFPKQWPNCGSVFLSDPAMYASIGPPGHAIEVCGLRGRTIGGAAIAPEHGNFILNIGSAQSDDILALIYLAQSTVEDRTGFRMKAEVRYVSTSGTMQPADEAARKRFAIRP